MGGAVPPPLRMSPAGTGGVGVVPPPQRMRPVGTGGVGVVPPPRLSPVGIGDVEVPSLRLLSRVPLPLQSAVEAGNAEVPKRKRSLKKWSARDIVDGLIL